MSYESALFCQLFNEELARHHCSDARSFRRGIRSAMRRLSPTLPAPALRTYTNSLFDTIVDDATLRPDWQERVHEEH